MYCCSMDENGIRATYAEPAIIDESFLSIEELQSKNNLLVSPQTDDGKTDEEDDGQRTASPPSNFWIERNFFFNLPDYQTEMLKYFRESEVSTIYQFNFLESQNCHHEFNENFYLLNI